MHTEPKDLQHSITVEQNLLYHYDNIGSTTLLTNITGTIIERFAYGTYGELLQKEKMQSGSYTTEDTV